MGKTIRLARASRRAFITVVSTVAMMALAPVTVTAQVHCTQWVDTLLDTTSSCVNDPIRDRAIEVEAFQWKGHDYMIFNRGNEFSIYNIDDPVNPTLKATSNFNFGTRGDSDYDLTQFDICDDCRYGILAHKVKRTVVFDLGAGVTPAFAPGDYEILQVSPDQSLGGYVFKKGGQQYLIAADLPGGCDGGSGLYTVDDAGNLGLVECLELGGSPFLVRGLQSFVENDGTTYLYLAASDGPVNVFRADGDGASLHLQTLDESPPGMFGRRYELSIDAKNRRAASANFDDRMVRIYSLTDPAHPALQHTIPATATIVSLRSPSEGAPSTLAMAMIGWSRSTRTFMIGDGVPEEFEATYWSDDSLPHNGLPTCGFENGAALSSDGSVLFLSRNAVHQVFDLIDCLDPVPAVANLIVTPAESFPGDTVEIRNTSTGQIHRWATWVAEEPGGAVATGNAIPANINLWDIDFLVPQDLPWATSYRAHVKVESDDLVPATPEADAAIVIDRTPAASISVEPSTVVVGESVTLTATAEGNPAANPYLWTIDPPSGSSFTRSGASTIVTVDETGSWDFHLAVAYDHGAETGGLYEATASVLDFQPSSVVADFTISPPSPFHTDEITLDGSASRPVGGNLSFAWTVESTGHSYTGCPAAAVCTIPAESLEPDTTYDVTLTVTNDDDAAVSQVTKSLAVGNGNFQPTITYSPADPEIAEGIIFTIQGVPVDIDRATWSMGALGCSGADSTPECVPGLWTDCKAQVYSYAVSGTWTVNVSVEIDGAVIAATPTSITISNTGYCDADFGIFDDGFESGSFTQWSSFPADIFADGFESGTMSAWSSETGAP